MKRVLTFLAIMLLPLSVMAMTPVTDSDLSNVTGQAGVSICFDVTMDITMDTMAWGDTDGFAYTHTVSTVVGAGWVGLSNLNITNLQIWPRTDYTIGGPSAWTNLQMLTIDVGTLASTTMGFSALDNPTYVKIGVPTLSITMASMYADVKLGIAGTPSTIGGIGGGITIPTANMNQLMGKIVVLGLNMATGTNGAIYIGSHKRLTDTIGSGVTIGFKNMKIDYLNAHVMAWGDTDGMWVSNGTYATTGLSNAAYIGLHDFAIRGIVFNGAVLIDVGTCIAGTDTVGAGTLAFPSLVGCFDEMYAAAGMAGKSFVSFGFKNLSMTMAEMGGQVAVADTVANLGNAGNKMGDIYISNFKFTLKDNAYTGAPSFVHIYAH